MKFLKNVSCLFLLILFISSCTEENFEESGVDVDDPTPEMVDVNSIMTRSNESSDEGLEIDCFTIVYPFTLVDDQNNEHLITSLDDLIILESDSSVVIVNIEFPITIQQDDEDVIIENEDEFAEVFASCVPDGGWTEDFFPAYLINFENSCFQLSFPVQLLTQSNETITVDDEEAFNNALAAEDASFVYPFELIDESGNIVVVGDIDGLFNTLLSCNGFENGDSTVWNWEEGFEYVGCYKLEFPINLELQDGTTITVNNHMEFCDLLLQGEVGNYTYPLSLLDAEGNEVITNTEEELNELLLECYIGDIGQGIFIFLDFYLNEFRCFDYVYPLEIALLDSSTVEINSDQEFIELIELSFIRICCMVYPIDIFHIESEETITLNSTEEFFEFIIRCE